MPRVDTGWGTPFARTVEGDFVSPKGATFIP
jgi:hypothetical protein